MHAFLTVTYTNIDFRLENGAKLLKQIRQRFGANLTTMSMRTMLNTPEFDDSKNYAASLRFNLI